MIFYIPDSEEAVLQSQIDGDFGHDLIDAPPKKNWVRCAAGKGGTLVRFDYEGETVFEYWQTWCPIAAKAIECYIYETFSPTVH